MSKATQAAIEYLRQKLQGSAHLATGMPGGNCQLCDALDKLYAAAEIGDALKMAATHADSLGCQDCQIYEACHKAPKDSGRYGRLMCSAPLRYLDLWVEAARKGGTT